ncbi:MAG TPA: zf-TFIIB domain-containing protein [Tepidisphaeraceae bacterium]
MTCPSCDTEMEIRDRHGIEIDLCPACRGVWLDKGELEQVLERSGRFLEVPGEDARDRRGGHRRNDFYGKGFEWF